MLYGFLLDRASLSYAQGEKWRTEQGDPFVIFTIEEIRKRLRCGKNKAVTLLQQLEEQDLIQRDRPKKDGPYHIVIKPFLTEARKSNLPTPQNQTCPLPEIKPVQVSKTNLNNTDINNTEINNTDKITLLEREVKTQIEYDYLISNYPKYQMDAIVDVMVQTLAAAGKTILVSGMHMDAALVKQLLRQATSLRIDYIFDHMDEMTTPVASPRAYYLARLCEPESVVDQFYETLHKAYSF